MLALSSVAPWILKESRSTCNPTTVPKRPNVYDANFEKRKSSVSNETRQESSAHMHNWDTEHIYQGMVSYSF